MAWPGHGAAPPHDRGMATRPTSVKRSSAQAQRAARVWPRPPTAAARRSLSHFGEAMARRAAIAIPAFEPAENCGRHEAAIKALAASIAPASASGGHIVDVLVGVDNDRIAQFGHDRISTFGIGTEHDSRTWRAILRQLITLRLVDVDLAGHGGLSIAAGRTRLPARQANADAARGGRLRAQEAAKTGATRSHATRRSPPSQRRTVTCSRRSGRNAWK